MFEQFQKSLVLDELADIQGLVDLLYAIVKPNLFLEISTQADSFHYDLAEPILNW